MDYSGHNVFEDAIRFKFIKLVECFKKVSNIVRIKFYSHISNNKKAFDIMNQEIIKDDDVINNLESLIDTRNMIAHETKSYELFMIEQKYENIKIYLDFLTCIFLYFVQYYERKMNIEIIDEKWTLISNKD